eukprot:scaffold55364_cov48-Phaeocystis_antarctica.AAC.2
MELPDGTDPYGRVTTCQELPVQELPACTGTTCTSSGACGWLAAGRDGRGWPPLLRGSGASVGQNADV